MKPHTTVLAAGFAALTLSAAPQAVFAADAAATYQDIEETYGSVPGFFRLFQADDVSEAWGAFRALQLNPDVGLDAKSRELIGVALAAQGDCQLCLYFHVAAATANGASEAEIVAAAALVTKTRRLHTTFKRAGTQPLAFTRETDLVLWGDDQTAERGRPTLEMSQLESGSAAVCD
jgi:AhpD family alkylhydroperoxidase